jgi:lipid-A-disaccharide synthase
MKYFLIAGEPSGDMHGATLMQEIKKADSKASFTFMGGDLMNAQGGKQIKHYREMAFMGILPVLLNLLTIRKNFLLYQDELKKNQPDVLILIDYPGFNLLAAKFAKAQNIRVAYYISPKIWAWKTNRIKQIKAYVDRMFTIFPFETDFYKQFDYRVDYVGNPVADLIEEELNTDFDVKKFRAQNQLTDQPIIALLPGSRKSEISLLLPEMEKVISHFPNHQFVVAGAPGTSPVGYLRYLKSNIPIVYYQTYKLLRSSEAAIVASGTATLETALLGVPQVVIYKLNFGWFLEKIRGLILKQRFFSLVNLVANKEVVTELLQSEVTEKNLVAEVSALVNDQDYRNRMMNNYREVSDQLKSSGAAKNTANAIINFLSKD